MFETFSQSVCYQCSSLVGTDFNFCHIFPFFLERFVVQSTMSVFANDLVSLGVMQLLIRSQHKLRASIKIIKPKIHYLEMSPVATLQFYSGVCISIIKPFNVLLRGQGGVFKFFDQNNVFVYI